MRPMPAPFWPIPGHLPVQPTFQNPTLLNEWGSYMSVFHDRKDDLEKYEFMMGEARGRLAVTLDALTDALVLIGQHGVYCTSSRNPNVPALDLQAVTANINGAKELVQAVMERLRLEREEYRTGIEKPQQ